MRKGFAYGVLDIEGMLKRIREWAPYARIENKEKALTAERYLYEKPQKIK